MFAYDFEYDGQYLSDYGFTICSFNNSSDFEVVSAGSQITFNTVSRHRGKKYSLTGTQYDECVTTTFDICKDPCVYSDLLITNDEYREIVRWLNRNKFLKFQILNEDEEEDACYYDASFNVEKVVINKELYGLEITMESNRPFGYGQELTFTWTVSDIAKSYTLCDMSDEIGYTYPSLTITCAESGNLKLYNEMEDSTMVINNVSSGEVISIDGSTHIITSSLSDHNLYDDFNFEFFKIGNVLGDRNNKITSSLKCTITLKYAPIIKDAPI